MARNSLFSTYRQGENRVTASMLAVFERLEVSRLERLLGAAVGEASLSLLTFENQPKRPGKGSIPDARIGASFSYWLEVKTKARALNKKQLESHLAYLDEGGGADERLLVVTPDASQPGSIESLGDDRVFWFSFAALADAIDALLADPQEVVSEREQLLLRELQALFEEDALLGTAEDVAVVAAKRAYDEYLNSSAYLCQLDRSFRPGITHLAFYRSKRIEPLVPSIIEWRDEVAITHQQSRQWVSSRSPVDRRFAEVIEAVLAAGTRPEGSTNKIALLSAPDSDDTVRLDDPIHHSGSSAWVQSQRYTVLDRLKGAATTDDLQ